MDAFDWTCPHCNKPTTVTEERVTSGILHFTIPNASGRRFAKLQFIVCPNTQCRQFTFTVDLHAETKEKQYFSGIPADTNVPGECLNSWRLVPPSNAKVFPSYIAPAILNDYTEACLISKLSPKASATLARRCLQGMIRDFWKVKPTRLVDEVNAIQSKVDPLTWDAIDSVRNVGNIGAHMEKDVNVIVDVDPNEAELLIGLIETLLNEWYVAREERKKQLQDIKDMAAQKKQAKKSP